MVGEMVYGSGTGGNGELRDEGVYEDGKKEGRWIAYLNFGAPVKGLSGVFKNDVKISD